MGQCRAPQLPDEHTYTTRRLVFHVTTEGRGSLDELSIPRSGLSDFTSAIPTSCDAQPYGTEPINREVAILTLPQRRSNLTHVGAGCILDLFSLSSSPATVMSCP